ncbi:MAG: DUF5317 domain-containing protein [Actinomycetota bacterium]|nr:DUF5317 domain-containing protein [Actinomycetota bacterium]
MLVALLVGAVAAVVAVLRGGSLRTLAETHFKWVPLLYAALIVQLVFEFWSPSWIHGTFAFTLLLATTAAIAVFLFANRHLPGLAIAGVGLALNLVVIGVNGAMPVSVSAAREAGVASNLNDIGFKHERMGPDTRLRFLGDVIPIPNSQQIFSVGDVVLALGIGWLVYRRTLVAKSVLRATTVSG